MRCVSVELGNVIGQDNLVSRKHMLGGGGGKVDGDVGGGGGKVDDVGGGGGKVDDDVGAGGGWYEG